MKSFLIVPFAAFFFFGISTLINSASAKTAIATTPKASKTLADCHSAHDSDHSGDDGNQPAMNEVEAKLQECIKKVMDAGLDQRLFPLKKTNPTEYQTEMQLQAAFNHASEKFSSDFFDACEGSACGTCTPQSKLFEMRASQNLLMNQNDLIVTLETAKMDPAKASVRKKMEAKVKSYFDPFIEQYCKLPNDVWKAKQVPKDCLNLELTEITKRLQYFFAASEDDDSDVCSAFKLYEVKSD